MRIRASDFGNWIRDGELLEAKLTMGVGGFVNRVSEDATLGRQREEMTLACSNRRKSDGAYETNQNERDQRKLTSLSSSACHKRV